MWDREVDHDTVRLIMVKAITKSNKLADLMLEVHILSIIIPNNTNSYKMKTLDWIDVQAKDPVILELVQLWKAKRLGQRNHHDGDS